MSHPEIREQRDLDKALMTFKIAEVIAALKTEEAWKSSGKNSVTLSMGAGLRVVAAALRAGAGLEPHKASQPISVQVLEGELEIRTEAGDETVKEGGLLILQAGIPHSVQASKESAFLLTFGA